MKIGIMGSSFDPPHKAHIAIAEKAFEFLALDKMIFVPAFCAPLKANPHAAPFEDRIKMLSIALEDFPHPCEITEMEKFRGGMSYSVDTAAEISSQHPSDELFWIIGSDQLLQLHKWKNIAKLSTLVSFALFARPSYALEIPKELPHSVRILKVPFKEMDIASSQIRGSVKNREIHLDSLDAKVLNYIKENKLYDYA